METPVTADATAAAPELMLNIFQRSLAVFTRPASAWTGLWKQIQWWFPMLVVALFAAGMAAALHHRALLPMMTDAWREQVANGALPAEQAQRMEEFFGSPTGLTVTVVQQLLILPIVTLLIGLVIWFGVGFILGRRMPYRLALEVAAWSGLITLPAQLLTGVVAWSRETMKGVHVGFGVLLPDTESPTRLGIWLGAVLDALGPLSVWYVVVIVLGASALSGAPRKQAAWVLGGLYVALILLFASLGAMFAPVSS